MTDSDNLSRQRARELLKPLFSRPCSPEERVVIGQVEGYIRGLWREIADLNSQLSSMRSATIEECARIADANTVSCYPADGKYKELREVEIVTAEQIACSIRSLKTHSRGTK